jgi:hypothetical protein
MENQLIFTSFDFDDFFETIQEPEKTSQSFDKLELDLDLILTTKKVNFRHMDS